MLLFALALSAHAAPVAMDSRPDIDGAALQRSFHQVADEFGVPEKILLAIAYEASHFDPTATSAWAGYGLFDLRDDDKGPNVERAAILLDESPDLLIRDSTQNIRGAAALLAWEAANSNGGVLPDRTDLLAWWDAVTAFSGRHEPNLASMYANYIYELINFGVWEHGVMIAAEPVNHWVKAMMPMPTSCDYSGCASFSSACSDNYSNYSRAGSDIDYIVIHTVQGSYAGCISWFANCSSSVSAHYVVRSSDGEVTQVVQEADVAWHAGNWTYNTLSVGIEHEGYVEDPSTWYTTAMYMGSAALSADIISRTDVTADRSHIIGHYEVPGATHTDPGSGWDWDYYMSLLSGGSVTGDITGVIADTDIYTGARLEGVTVWISETGESTTSSATGYYNFYDIPLGTYTIYASMDGYIDGSCTKDLATGTNWCSIAMTPGSSGGDSGGGDSGGGSGGGSEGGGTDSGGAEGGPDSGGADTAVEDTGTPDLNPGPDPDETTGGRGPGELVEASKLGGGCSTSPAPGGGLALVGLALLARRRRHARA